MAKLGPKEKGGYDPFNAIADSLTALTTEAPAPQQAPPAQPQARQTEPPKPKKRASAPEVRQALAATVPAPAQPVVVEAPQPVATPVQDTGRGGRAVGGQEAAVPPPAAPAKPKAASSNSALQITKRFKTTRQEASQLDAAAVKLGAALGVSIDFSKLTRALWDVYMRHQEDILRNVPEGEVWERPANSDAAGLAELDERLADLINDGLMVACRRPNNSR